jgi:hypothetical protein
MLDLLFSKTYHGPLECYKIVTLSLVINEVIYHKGLYGPFEIKVHWICSLWSWKGLVRPLHLYFESEIYRVGICIISVAIWMKARKHNPHNVDTAVSTKHKFNYRISIFTSSSPVHNYLLTYIIREQQTLNFSTCIFYSSVCITRFPTLSPLHISFIIAYASICLWQTYDWIYGLVIG